MTAAIRDRRAPAMTTIVVVVGPSVTGGSWTRYGGDGSHRGSVTDAGVAVTVVHVTYHKLSCQFQAYNVIN